MKRLLFALAATSALTLPAFAQQAAQPNQSSGQMQITQPQYLQANGQYMQNQAGAQTQPISPRSLSSSDVRNIQVALNKKGFDAGHVDGDWGPHTRHALRDFQRYQGLANSGQLDQQTLSALGVNVAEANNTGMNGQGQSMAQSAMLSPRSLSRREVSNLQIALNKRGFDAGYVDGDWGPHTRQALSDFQKQHGMSSVGQIDQQTLSALGVNVAALSPSQQGNQGQMNTAQANPSTSPMQTNTGGSQNLAANGNSSIGVQPNQIGSNAAASSPNLAANGNTPADTSQNQTGTGNPALANQNMAANTSAAAGANPMGAQQVGQSSLKAFGNAKVSLADAVSTAQNQLPSGKIFAIAFDGSGSTPVFHVEAYEPGSKSVWTAEINADTGQVVGTPSTKSSAALSQQEIKAISSLSSNESISTAIGSAQSTGNGKPIQARLEQGNDGTPSYVVTLASNGATQRVMIDPKTGQATNG